MGFSGKAMSSFYAMRRANGDWFALPEKGRFLMPVFQSGSDATAARMRDSGMECFRPAIFDKSALEELKITDGDTASFLIVTDPSVKLKRGRPLGFIGLAALMSDCEKPNQDKV
jgi:hypothetical protein